MNKDGYAVKNKGGYAVNKDGYVVNNKGGYAVNNKGGHAVNNKDGYAGGIICVHEAGGPVLSQSCVLVVLVPGSGAHRAQGRAPAAATGHAFDQDPVQSCEVMPLPARLAVLLREWFLRYFLV